MVMTIIIIFFGIIFIANLMSETKKVVEEEEEKPTKDVPSEKSTVMETRILLPIETLEASKAYPAALVKLEMEGPAHGSNLYDMATKALAEQIADNLIPYLEIKSDYDVVNQVQIYYARLRVIKPK